MSFHKNGLSKQKKDRDIFEIGAMLPEKTEKGLWFSFRENQWAESATWDLNTHAGG